MKKILLLAILVTSFISCDKDDEICYKDALYSTDKNYPVVIGVYENFPYDCDTGKPREDIAKKTNPDIRFVEWAE